ncbi:dienelactone hydrolase family protein [bacterium]|nr:dienelactone hydrolase family protein [bacterium]
MNKSQLKYSLILPQGYEVGKGKLWPLVVFLHGAGERGDDLEKLKVHGPTKLAAQGKQFPFIILAPLCPEDCWWNNEADKTIKLIDETVSNYNVDKNRIYLTGISMGGYGTWHLAAKIPNRLAAIAPICGGGDPASAGIIKNIPVWVFHGDKDPTVPIEKSQEMVDAVRSAGGSPKLTIYPGIEHDSWTATYESDEFWQWMLEQKRP